jgi:hypothetical protein
MPKNFVRKGKGLKNVAKRLKSGYVTVGVHRKEGQHDGSDLTVAGVAAIHEFGARGIPERSFMRTTVFEQKKKLREALRKIARGQFHSKNSTVAIKKLGEYLRGKIQAKIVAIRTPPNSPKTINRKKSSNPLIDTGQMLQSIHSVYHKKQPK